MENSSIGRDWRLDPDSRVATSAHIGDVSFGIDLVDRLAASEGIRLEKQIEFAKKGKPVQGSNGNVLTTTTILSAEFAHDERSRLRMQKEQNSSIRDSLKTLDYYVEKAEEIETELQRLRTEYVGVQKATQTIKSISGDTLSEQEKLKLDLLVENQRKKVADYESKNIPAELREEKSIVPSENPGEVEKQYLENLPDWILVAREEQQRAIETVKEKNKTPEQRDLEVRLAAAEASANGATRLQEELKTAKKLLAQERDERKRAEEIAERVQREQLATPQSASPAESFTLAGKMVRESENMTAAELNQLIEGKFMSKVDLTDDQRRKMIAEGFIKKYDLPSDYQNIPRPTEAPENLRRNEGFGNRIRQNLDYILGGVTGFVTTEAAAGAALWAFPQLGPIGVELASVAATLGWTGLWISSEYKKFKERLPRVTRFLRGSVVGSLAGTTINTAASALESAGIINIMSDWPNGVEQTAPQVLEKIATAVPSTTEISVKSGQNLSTIVKDTLHLTNPQDIYRHTVDTILGNLDKLPADKIKLVSGLTTDQVMHDSKLFRLVMDAGRIIHPGQVFTIR